MATTKTQAVPSQRDLAFLRATARTLVRNTNDIERLKNAERTLERFAFATTASIQNSHVSNASKVWRATQLFGLLQELQRILGDSTSLRVLKTSVSAMAENIIAATRTEAAVAGVQNLVERSA